ncbi:hypothetical protein F442_14569 [Plasmopara halstedii]|uniref:FAD-binding FR-type domain-containing protein n=1 Tax=Plasmopara halstedii TaxID=4781 RepID=A0A0P1AH13_PLAHL|nr:hypothetical protein F442_14569 [Plasmopara halstedii]CEG40377.1 hypothetical protein F442_14569 [Plasmopara halstedii]|eukprot:XP_024576746.1 hypothetical protein F442_14569 [Plasmopara halstedii]
MEPNVCTEGKPKQQSSQHSGVQYTDDQEQQSTPRASDYMNDLQTEPLASKESRRLSSLRKIARSWTVLRYQLARNLFSVSLPLLTSRYDIKLGDLLITIPICVIYIVTTAIMAIPDRKVESTGNPPTYGLLIVFLLTVRNNSPLLLLTGISYERALFYHKLSALTTIILSGLHGLSYILAHNKREIADQVNMVITGTIAFAAMMLMFGLSLNYVRRHFFDFFLRSHYILFIVVAVFAVIHGASTALIGIIPWILDMAFRHAYRPRVYARGFVFQMKGSLLKSPVDDIAGKCLGIIARDQVSMTALPGKVIRIQFPRVRKDTGEVFNYVAGQYVFLCIPTISSLQWHPFTISSSPHESMVTFHIRAEGDWTSALQSLVAASYTTGVSSPVDILVDGPYGNICIDLETRSTYSHFALFAGGIGVTPMRSIVNQLHHEAQEEGRANIERVHFVWSVHEQDLVQSFVIDDHYSNEHKGESYFPSGIINSHNAVFSTDIYISRTARTEHDVESSSLDRYLEGTIRYGTRPDIAASLRLIGELAKQNGKKRIAVLVCGPQSMVRDVIDKSFMLSHEMKVRFDVHSEVFEL